MAGQHARYKERRMNQQLQSRGRRIGRQILWTVGVVVTVAAVVFVLNRFFVHHPLWDWLKLLIVPAVLAGGGLWFNAQQREREQRTANARAHDEALQAYLDQMGQLLLDKGRPLRQSKEGDEVRTLARARTLTLLSRLDGARKRSVLQFMYESGLLNKGHRIVGLQQADLSDADLHGAKLSGADLSGADLTGARLSHADLSSANLAQAKLVEADLSGAILGTAAPLQTAAYVPTDLEKANLSKANLTGIVENLGMDEAAIHNGVIAAWDASFEGATMPDGQKYEDWLGTPEGQSWLRTVGENLGTHKDREGVYKEWIKTTEGKLWLRAVEDDEEHGGPS